MLSSSSSARIIPLHSSAPSMSSGKAARSLEGTRLGDRYSVLAPIGSGGMGTVYEARDEQTGRIVAIKALKVAPSPTSESFQRFRREALSTSAIRHPHLCQVHELGMANGIPYIVMERLVGETLRARLTREGGFSLADTVAVGVQLLDALAAAHEARVLHRDVKPDNVFIMTPSGETPTVKLIDFGLARNLEDSGDSTLITVVGAIPGTPAYLSPEQITGERALDEGVDIWAAGLTLFEMLTGRHGFAADRLDLLAQRITSTPSPSARELRRDVPRELDDVLAKALAKRRSDRWSSANAFREALIAAWAHHQVSALDAGTRLRSGTWAAAVTTKNVDPESTWAQDSSSAWLQLHPDKRRR